MKRLINTGNNQLSKKFLDKSIPVIFIVLLLIAWQIIVDRGSVPKYILPSPSDIVVTTIKSLPEMAPHILATLEEAFIGFFISIILAVVLSLIMNSIDIVKKAVYPLLIISQTVPIIVLAPLFVMWFGFGMMPKIIVVVLVCFFPIVISLLQGLESVDKDMVNLLRSMGASNFKIFILVKFPASLVSFFSGLKVAATYSIMGAVIGEWLGGENGLGLYMLRAKKGFSIDKVFGVVILIVLISSLLFNIIAYLQKRLMPWSKE